MILRASWTRGVVLEVEVNRMNVQNRRLSDMIYLKSVTARHTTRAKAYDMALRSTDCDLEYTT